jgi:hypothetical protein
MSTLAYPRCRACAAAPSGQLHCHRCNTDKPARDFYPAPERGRYLSGCIDCRRTASRARAGALASAESKRQYTREVIFQSIREVIADRVVCTATLNEIVKRSGYSKTQIIRVVRREAKAGALKVTVDQVDRRAWRVGIVEQVPAS